MAWDTKSKLTLRKRHVFVTEKYVGDVKQDEKSVPDLLESIIRSTDHVKEELRCILMKLNQFRTKITKIKICTFQMSGKKYRFALEAACRSKVSPF